jgi:hypothetical protein
MPPKSGSQTPSLAATVLVFIFYRRWVRRKLGMEEDA